MTVPESSLSRLVTLILRPDDWYRSAFTCRNLAPPAASISASSPLRLSMNCGFVTLSGSLE